MLLGSKARRGRARVKLDLSVAEIVPGYCSGPHVAQVVRIPVHAPGPVVAVDGPYVNVATAGVHVQTARSRGGDVRQTKSRQRRPHADASRGVGHHEKRLPWLVRMASVEGGDCPLAPLKKGRARLCRLGGGGTDAFREFIC